MTYTITDATIALSSSATSGYKYVHIIEQVTIDDTTVYNTKIVDSTSSTELEADGYYIIVEIQLPTTAGEYYYTDGSYIYDPTGEVITSEELVSLNSSDAGFTREDTDIMLTYYLNTKLLSSLTEKFKGDLCGCGCSNIQEQITVDYLLMGMFLLEQLIATEQYYETQRIIERLSYCVGITSTNCNCND